MNHTDNPAIPLELRVALANAGIAYANAVASNNSYAVNCAWAVVAAAAHAANLTYAPVERTDATVMRVRKCLAVFDALGVEAFEKMGDAK